MLFAINLILSVFSFLLPSLRILQLEEYSMCGLIKYCFKNKTFYCVLILLNCFIGFLFFLSDEILNLVCIAYLSVILLWQICSLIKHKNYICPKFTNRIKRIIFIYSILTIGVLVLTITSNILSISAYILSYICVYVTIICMFLTITSNFIIKIYEWILLKKYIKKAKNKLKNSDIIKIGITGTYGKTSVKNILTTILSEKYNVLMTPESYNTPSGISLTINNNDIQKYDVIVMEMGAKRKGDIAKLCRDFSPQYGILTSIGQQHLQSFKSIDNIVKTKSEILKYVSSMVFNCNNNYVLKLHDNYCGNKLSVGLGNFNVLAKEIKLSQNGTNFEVLFNGEKLCDASTELMGEHNVENILLAVGMAILLNLSGEQISSGIKKLKPIKSRMGKCILSSGAVVINNGYNSNPQTAKKSLQLLQLYNDRRKIVITPGFVEMGKVQYRLNYEFGTEISKIANECIIVNRTNRKALMTSLKKSKVKCHVVDKFQDIDFSQFGRNDVVLIENDLPSNYK